MDDTIRNFSSKYNKYHHHANDSGDDAAHESADNADNAADDASNADNADNASVDSWNDEPSLSSSKASRKGQKNSLIASRQDSHEEEPNTDDEEASFA